MSTALRPVCLPSELKNHQPCLHPANMSTVHILFFPSSILFCISKHMLLHLVINLVEKSSDMAASSHLWKCQVSQGSPYDYSLHVPVWRKLATNSAVGMSNVWSLSALTSLPPIASNIFSSCTLSCWMLFIRMQGWRDKSRCLLLLRMATHFHGWYRLCLNTLPQVPPDLTDSHSQIGGRASKNFSTQT